MKKKSHKDQQPQPQDQNDSPALDDANPPSTNADSVTTPSPDTASATRDSRPPSPQTDTAQPKQAAAAPKTRSAAKPKENAKALPADSASADSTSSEPSSSKTAAPVKPTPQAPTSQAKTAQHRSSISKLALIALVLVLLTLGLVGYGYNLIQQLHIQQREQVSALQQQLRDSSQTNQQLQQQNGQILGELNQVRSTAATQQRNVDELQTRLSKAMQQVSKLGTDTRKDWLLAEVEYLLRLANQRVLMERTASGALSLLQGADKILHETDDVSIYPVRKALAQNILALEAVPTLDIEGMFLKLVAIDSQIDQLRLLPRTDKHQLPEMLQQITADNLSQGWQDGLATSWANTLDKLGKLIVIRHREEPVTPLLSPEQHYFLTQNLHLMLEQTQLALLQGKQQAYDTGLTKASTWIITYFQASDPTAQALATSLKALQGIEISPTLPNISSSLTQLNSYLTELHNLEGAAR